MAIQPRRWVRNRLRLRAMGEWQRLAEATGGMTLRRLRELQDDARGLRRSADRFIAIAQSRLDSVQRPVDLADLPRGTDRRWRPPFLSTRIAPSGIAAPASGTWLGEQAAVWHDCPAGALILRQMPNRGAADLAPFGLLLETLGFSGSYLSVSVTLPDAARDGLTRAHIIRLDVTLTVERPMSIYARLNIGHGPNTDTLLRHLGDIAPGPEPVAREIEFDLHYVEMNEKRLEKLWLDLIFEAPQMNAVRIRDLFLSRHLRADV